MNAITSVVDVERLERDLPSVRATYAGATPFRHVVIDGLFEDAFAHQLYADYPRLDARQHALARMLQARSYDGDVARHGPNFERAFAALSEPAFTAWLRRLTGIDDLEMDPACVGGGVHQGARGSHLPVHADHNTHPSDDGKYRRINVLVYLNERWEPGWNGDLELYDAPGDRVVKRVAPLFNRCIVMEVHDYAFHGYRVLKMPNGLTRKALAAYYYSSYPHELQRPEAHATTFGAAVLKRPLTHALMRARFWVRSRLPGVEGLPPKS